MCFEYIDGETLEELVKSNKYQIQHIYFIIVKLVETISYLHDNEYIHRDLKPNNIMIIKENDKDIDLKIIDFGISILNDYSMKTNSCTRGWCPKEQEEIC